MAGGSLLCGIRARNIVVSCLITSFLLRRKGPQEEHCLALFFSRREEDETTHLAFLLTRCFAGLGQLVTGPRRARRSSSSGIPPGQYSSHLRSSENHFGTPAAPFRCSARPFFHLWLEQLLASRLEICITAGDERSRTSWHD